MDLNDLIEQREQDRLKKVADREMRDRKQRPTSFYYGHDAATGRAIVALGGGLTSTRSLSTAQPVLGQLGKGLPAGLDAGNVRRTKIEIFPKTDKYPFKTISTVSSNTFLGGDRTPQQLFDKYAAPGLSNTGGKSQWIASLVPFGGSSLQFYSAGLNIPTQTLLVAASRLVHKGSNFWTETTPFLPGVTVTRSTVSGSSPPTNITGDVFNLESGVSDANLYNFSINDNYTVSLPGAAWAPYNAGVQNIGAQTWTMTTTFDGVTGSRPSGSFPAKSIQRTESRSGDLRYPVRLFNLYPNVSNNLGFLGEGQRLRQATVNSSSARAVDFSTFDSISTKSDKTVNKTEIPIAILNQQFSYFSETFSETNSTTKDTRQVVGGTTATWEFNETRVNRSLNKNPLQNLLMGGEVAYVPIDQTATIITQVTADIKRITSNTWSHSVRPFMTSIVLYTTSNYINSFDGQRQGPLGGWYAFSNANINEPGQNAPIANLRREGDPPGNIAAQSSLYTAEYDVIGAYGDNFTTENTYSEYDLTESRNIRNDIYTIAESLISPFNLVMNRTRTVNYTYDYLLPVDRKIVTPEGVFSIFDNQVITASPSSQYVSVPEGVGTITLSAPANSNALGISILTGRDIQQRQTQTLTQTYTNGVRTQNVSSIDVTYVGNSLPSLVGKKAEVYRYLNNKLTKWTGVIVSYSGVNSPGIPPASRTRPDGTLETNTIEGVFSQTITVNNLVINAESVEISDYSYTGSVFYSLILNLDYYFILRINPSLCNLVAGSGDLLATLYVANQSTYKAGSINTVDVWEFTKSGDNAIPKYMGTKKGKTKKGVDGESLQSILYCPIS